MSGRNRVAWGLPPLLLGAAAIVWGCQVTPTGVLGNGGFQYLCTNQEGDSSCSSTTDTTSLPGAVAVGAKFQLGYAPKSSAYTTTQGANGYEVVPASQELALASSNTIVAQRPGYVALLARHVGTATVDDFVFLKLETITSIKTTSASVSLSPGQAGTIEVQAFDKLGAELAGQLACTWKTSDASVVKVTSTTGLGKLVAGCNGGAATVTATCGAAALDVPVTVDVGGCIGDAGSDANDGSSGNDANSSSDASDGGGNG
jgi:hypothetical protein